MLRMYIITVSFAVAVWAVTHFYFSRGPITDDSTRFVAFMCGGIIPLTVFGFFWNVVKFKGVKMPQVLEFIRIPWAAIALGINSALYKISFENAEVQREIRSPSIIVAWLLVEVVLVVSLIIGILRTETQQVQGE